MRRAVIVAALTAILATGAGGLPESSGESRHMQQNTERERDANWRQDECRFATLNGIKGRQPGEIRKTISCAAEHFPVALDTAFAVVSCESGFHEDADNPSSSAAGVWQFIDSTWHSVRSRFGSLMDRWGLRPSVYNGRANAVLGVRKASLDGFGAWHGCL